MSRIYRDYFNQTIVTIPDNFIDVKTGEKRLVSSKIFEQLDYHSKNNTLNHLIFSALTNYLQTLPAPQQNTNELMIELQEIKQMLRNGNRASSLARDSTSHQLTQMDQVNIEDIEDVLEAFRG